MRFGFIHSKSVFIHNLLGDRLIEECFQASDTTVGHVGRFPCKL